MDTVQSKDGTTIAYERTGSGPALILVAGATAFRALDPKSAQLAALLAPDFTVITYDRRGRGESGDTLPYAAEREFEDLAALIELAGGAASVFGVSSGAVLALNAAASGIPASKLALYEPPVVVDAGRPPLPADYVQHLDALQAEGRRGDMFIYFLVEAVGIPAEYAEATRGEPFFPAMEAVAHTIAYDGRQMGSTMSGRPLPAMPWGAIRIPSMVIDGGASPEWMHTGADAVAAVLPNAPRRTLPGQTHDFDPEVIAPVLKDFFAG